MVYPRISHVIALFRCGKCACYCRTLALYRIDIERSFLASENESFDVCREHLALAHADLRKFLSRAKVAVL